jgi:hypothetical protein
MSHESEFNYFEKMAHWNFDEFGIREESSTDWDLYALLKSVGGGIMLLRNYYGISAVKPS